MKQYRRYLPVLIWLLAAVSFFFIYDMLPHPITLALWLLSMILPVVGLVEGKLVSRRVKLAVKMDSHGIKQHTYPIQLQVKNSSWLPVIRCHCQVKVHNLLTNQIERTEVIAALHPKDCQNLELSLETSWCGMIQVCVEENKVSDVFGIYRFSTFSKKSEKEKQVSAFAQMLILPDTFEPEITVVADENCPDDGEAYSDVKAGWDLSEPLQIREYEEGDSPKQIHWKLSEKYDKLIVKDAGLPLARSLVILWDHLLPENIMKEKLFAIEDTLAEVMLSICQKLSEEYLSYHLLWNDGDSCEACEIPNMDILCEMIPKLLSASFYSTSVGQESQGIIAQFMEMEELMHAPHIVYVGMRLPADIDMLAQRGYVTALLCGDMAENFGGEQAHIVSFTPEDYPKVLCTLYL